MSNSFKKVWNIFTSILIAIVVVIAVLLAGMRLIGYDVFTVLSGSMEPEIHTGSVVYVKDVDYKELKVGDVITYMLDEDTFSTHRIVEIIPDEDDPEVIRFKTKGDANASADGAPVHCQNVIGSPKFSIPYLGYLAEFIKNPPGTYVAIAAGIILLILVFLPEILSDDKEKEKKKKKAEAEKASKTAASEEASDEENSAENK